MGQHMTLLLNRMKCNQGLAYTHEYIINIVMAATKKLNIYMNFLQSKCTRSTTVTPQHAHIDALNADMLSASYIIDLHRWEVSVITWLPAAIGVLACYLDEDKNWLVFIYVQSFQRIAGIQRVNNGWNILIYRTNISVKTFLRQYCLWWQ